MILIAFRHGLRASELTGLQWSDVEFETATLHLRRAKGGISATHPLLGDELRVLRNLKRGAKSPFVFTSERGAPFTVAGFAKLIERAGIAAKFGFKLHPHMLRHACGYALANRGTDTRTLQAYLGHRSIQSTVRYSELAPGRFKNIWLAAWFAVALVTAIGQPPDIELKARCTGLSFCAPPAPRGYEPQPPPPEEPEIQFQPRAPGLPPPLNLLPTT
jgi:integrase